MNDQSYTVEELDALNKEVLEFLDTKGLTPSAAVVIAAGVLLSVIHAVKAETVRVPADVLRLEPLLEETLRKGVPVVTAPREVIARHVAAAKARMN